MNKRLKYKTDVKNNLEPKTICSRLKVTLILFEKKNL